MNVYILVEGSRTEMQVYPAWLSIIAPNLIRVERVEEISNNNYFLFSGCGIPSIYKHISNAVADINKINACGKIKIDYLLVCLDTEQEDRKYILNRIEEQLQFDDRGIADFQLRVFEQKVCMETWFLGNRKIFKKNPQDVVFQNLIRFYNVSVNDPEEMANGNKERCTTKAQFHSCYLKAMLRERNVTYSKNDPSVVCTSTYLNELIGRCQSTEHLKTFCRWYEFVINNLRDL